MSHHIVELKDVFYSYPHGTEALKGISFRVIHGESVGLVGTNGAGKTTLLLNLNGHLIPTGGEISIGEVPLSKGTRQEIRRKVGFVFQRPDDQLFMPIVYEAVAFGPINLGLSMEKVDERVKNARVPSARLTPETKNMPLDTMIIGIVDKVHVDSACVYSRETNGTDEGAM